MASLPSRFRSEPELMVTRHVAPRHSLRRRGVGRRASLTPKALRVATGRVTINRKSLNTGRVGEYAAQSYTGLIWALTARSEPARDV